MFNADTNEVKTIEQIIQESEGPTLLEINIPLSTEEAENAGLVGAYLILNVTPKPVMLVADLNTDPIEIIPKYFDETQSALTPMPIEDLQVLLTFLEDGSVLDLSHLVGDVDGTEQPSE